MSKDKNTKNLDDASHFSRLSELAKIVRDMSIAGRQYTPPPAIMDTVYILNELLKKEIQNYDPDDDSQASYHELEQMLDKLKNTKK